MWWGWIKGAGGEEEEGLEAGGGLDGEGEDGRIVGVEEGHEGLGVVDAEAGFIRNQDFLFDEEKVVGGAGLIGAEDAGFVKAEIVGGRKGDIGGGIGVA